MPTRDHIIYWSITAFMFVGIIVCCVWFRTPEQIASGAETSVQQQSVIEILVPYATVIGAAVALISVVVAVFIRLRKTEKQMVEELKDALLTILSQNGSYTIIDGTEDDEFQLLDSKYQTSKYTRLHRHAFNELKGEDKIKVIPDPQLPGPDAY